MTPEREKEIRDFAEHGEEYTSGKFETIRELLEEIDRLRESYRNSLQDTHDVIRENNKLKATLLPWNPETALEYRKIIADADLVNENQHLRARVEKLREALTHYSDRYQYDKCSADETVAVNAIAQDDEMEWK